MGGLQIAAVERGLLLQHLHELAVKLQAGEESLHRRGEGGIALLSREAEGAACGLPGFAQGQRAEGEMG